MNKKRAVFLDRDGTILNERGYLGDPKKIKFYATAFRGLQTFQKLGFKLIIVSNQSGVARGYFSLAQLAKINRSFTEQLRRRGIHISKIYFCPHSPEGGCSCRKPKPGMIHRAARELKIDLKSSYMIGDQQRDIQLAQRTKLKGLLVLTGAGKYYRGRVKKMGFKVTQNLTTASAWIRRQESKIKPTA